MSGTEVRLRRGTTAQHAAFTGAGSELTIDTTLNTAVVHDGATLGGVPLAKANGTLFTNVDINSGTIDGTILGGSVPAAATISALTVSTSISLPALSIADAALAQNYIQATEVDGLTIEFSSSTLNVVAGGIGDTQLGTLSAVDIDGGTIDGVSIGASTPATAITATGLTVNTTLSLPSDSVTLDFLVDATTTDILLGRSAAGGGTFEEIALTAAGRALIDDASSTAQRTTLGLGSAAVASLLDEDTMSSNDATAAASQQSIKAYVDTEVASVSKMTLGTSVATTSGTSIDFTSIPAAVNRVTINLDQVSTNGVDSIRIQIGDSGGIETTGYDSATANQADTISTSTAGLDLMSAQSEGINGRIILERRNGNDWIMTVIVTRSTAVVYGSCQKQLSGELDRVRITTTGGTDTFDAGNANITYES